MKLKFKLKRLQSLHCIYYRNKKSMHNIIFYVRISSILSKNIKNINIINKSM